MNRLALGFLVLAILGMVEGSVLTGSMILSVGNWVIGVGSLFVAMFLQYFDNTEELSRARAQPEEEEP